MSCLDCTWAYPAQVLIETLWNVNLRERLSFWTGMPVLIETLWNVNQDKSSWGPSLDRSINRNIVECKCFRPMLPEDSMTVLIETL